MLLLAQDVEHMPLDRMEVLAHRVQYPAALDVQLRHYPPP